MVIPTCPHCVPAGEVPDEKLKISKLGPNVCEPNKLFIRHTSSPLNRGYLNPHCHIRVSDVELSQCGSLPAELALERLKGALECSDQVLKALSLVFDEDTFPSN